MILPKFDNLFCILSKIENEVKTSEEEREQNKQNMLMREIQR